MEDAVKPKPRGAELTLREANALFEGSAWSEKFPPLLSVEQVAELLQVPKSTVYCWSSQGLLDPCKCRVGKHLRLQRDRFVQLVSEGKLHGAT